VTTAGQLVLEPLQDAACVSVPPAQEAARQDVPALPAGWLHAPAVQTSALQTLLSAVHAEPSVLGGCWQAALEPSHSSLVHSFASSVQLVAFGFLVSTHAVEAPSQVSAMSHSPAAARQGAPALPAGCEHEPALSHSSSVHGLVSEVQGVPAALGGCWHESRVPLHVSVVQMLPSSVQGMPLAFFTSVQVVAAPSQTSIESHSPAAPRHCAPIGRGRHSPSKPGLLHAWQSPDPPAQAFSQQYPSTQLSLTQ
jgi:hypothetical protein